MLSNHFKLIWQWDKPQWWWGRNLNCFPKKLLSVNNSLLHEPDMKELVAKAAYSLEKTMELLEEFFEDMQQAIILLGREKDRQKNRHGKLLWRR